MTIRMLMLSFLIALAPLLPARADDVTDQINEALAAYGRKDVSTAMAGLEAALNLLRQKRADVYGTILPPAPRDGRRTPLRPSPSELPRSAAASGHRGNTTEAETP